MASLDRSNKVYKGPTEPKRLAGTDRSLAALVIGAAVMMSWVAFSWKVAAGSFVVAYVTLKFAKTKSDKDPWWWRLYKPFNRYVDVYVPWPQKKMSERFLRPYGFNQNVKQ
jgi:type IV secretory pathway TrbD component